MANKPITMSKLKQVIRLHQQGKGKRFIARYLQISRNTVKKYLKQVISVELPLDELLALNDSKLNDLFHVKGSSIISERMKELYSFFPHVDKRIGKIGVTRSILWQEYKEKYPSGYQFSQFCTHYSKWHNRVTPVMRIEHKASDKLFVDYAGKTLELVDTQSGEIIPVQFFVGVLGYSQYTYAEASISQQKNDFVKSVENALHYFEGVPRAIVTDNLKAAVTKSSRYEPTINETFADFAEHYGTTVLPARAYKPKDKALVEGTIRILYSRIYAILQEQSFTDLSELNEAIKPLLVQHNQTKFSHRPYSRANLFNEVEQQELFALPVHRYQIKEQSFATVMMNGHVCLGHDKHYYSVPYQYIKKKVKLRYSEKEVEIYYQYSSSSS